jgi:excisionase family DNA binding protein
MDSSERKLLKEYPDVLEVKDLCKVLGISEKTAYGLLRRGAIQHIRIGRLYKVPKKCVYRYLDANLIQ